jgi:hypothetical protein
MTPAATIEAVGTNTKQLACSSLQLHSLLDNENADGKHPAHKCRQTTTSGMQPSAPELRTCNNNMEGKHSARKHCQTTMSSTQPPASELRTCNNNNNELSLVAEDLNKDNGLYNNDGKGGNTQDKSSKNNWGAEEEGIIVSYHELSTANSLTFI